MMAWRWLGAILALAACGGEVAPTITADPPEVSVPTPDAESCAVRHATELGTRCDPASFQECCDGTWLLICHSSYPWVQQEHNGCL